MELCSRLFSRDHLSTIRKSYLDFQIAAMLLTNPIKRKSTAGSTIVRAGLLSGLLDAIAASVMFMITSGGKSPELVWRYVASAVLKADAYSGGKVVILWGLLFHFMIAFIWTCLYFVAYPYIKFLHRNSIVSGLLYGIVIWIGMNFVVVPISFAKKGSFDLIKALPGIIVLMVCVGLPIAIIVGRYYKRRGTESI